MNVFKNADYVKTFARRFGIGQWSFIGPGSEKEVLFFREQSTRNLGQHCGTDVAGICRKWTSHSSVQRLHCPGVSSRAKGDGKLSIHFAADQDTIDTIYRIISFCQSAQCLRSSGSHMRGI